MPAEAKRLASGDQATASTQFRWPLHVCIGSSVFKSHRRTVESPLPEANFLESGLKATHSTACTTRDLYLKQRIAALTQ